MNDVLLEKLLNSKKYRDVCEDTVRRVWNECNEKFKKAKDIDKAVRERLHGITGAFITTAEASRCLDDMLRWSESGHMDECLEQALSRHTSTRERLPLSRLNATYDRIFEVTGTPGSVLDLACGINPIALAARGIPCTGSDISGLAVQTLNACAQTCKLPIAAVCADLLCGNAVPDMHFHTALLFKILPLLERQKNGAAVEIINRIDADYIVVSFPTRSLSGRNVGMATNYAVWMETHLPETHHIIDSFNDENELFYILKEC